LLSKINNTEERRLYEIEALINNWALSELKRQFNSALYERLHLSRDKSEMKQMASKGCSLNTKGMR
jgi:predicted nuclease of restriction endonuclease-like (RecB) superfamily